jgi:hypothetical protein
VSDALYGATVSAVTHVAQVSAVQVAATGESDASLAAGAARQVATRIDVAVSYGTMEEL